MHVVLDLYLLGFMGMYLAASLKCKYTHNGALDICLPRVRDIDIGETMLCMFLYAVSR
jgi:hypothetical protein